MTGFARPASGSETQFNLITQDFQKTGDYSAIHKGWRNYFIITLASKDYRLQLV